MKLEVKTIHWLNKLPDGARQEIHEIHQVEIPRYAIGKPGSSGSYVNQAEKSALCLAICNLIIRIGLEESKDGLCHRLNTEERSGPFQKNMKKTEWLLLSSCSMN